MTVLRIELLTQPVSVTPAAKSIQRVAPNQKSPPITLKNHVKNHMSHMNVRHIAFGARGWLCDCVMPVAFTVTALIMENAPNLRTLIFGEFPNLQCENAPRGTQ